MRVTYMNGCGNRFAVFDARKTAFRPTEAQIRQIANPPGAKGFDQIIALENSMRGHVFMRIWNSDGGEVSACGNATRCVGSLIMNEAAVDAVTIETEAGLLKASDAGEAMVTVDMGSPLLKWEEIPLSEKMDTRGVDLKIGPIDDPVLSRPACVSMGNPHAVFFVPDVGAIDVPAIGPLVEWHPIFPEGVNAGFAEVLTRESIRLRVWERGAGLTLACGTGACAALVCAARLNLTERKARMVLDGGELMVEWRETDDRVLMTGPIELEWSGEL